MARTGKQKLHHFMAVMHKWIGLVVGIQVVLWTMGGGVLSWMPIEEVRREHKIAHTAPAAMEAGAPLLPFSDLAERASGAVVQLTYDTLLGRPVAKLRLEGGDMEILDAVTGDALTPLASETAQAIAEADYAPDYPVSEVIRLTENNIDYRGPLPVWRVNFADEEETSLYVSMTEARVVARRSEKWRLFDFFWMLHIMDYEERHDFNNPLLITFSVSALLFAFSGIFLLFFRFYRRDFNFILGKKKRG